MKELTLMSSGGDWHSDEELERLLSLGAIFQHNAIVRRAHQSFVERGCAHGLDLQDWLEAEKEVRGSR